MATYAQSEALRLKTPLGPDALLLERFHGREAISEPFQFHLDLLAEASTNIAFDAIVGQQVTVELALPDGSTRYFNGMVNRFSQGDPVPAALGAKTFIGYRAEVVPRAWMLTKKFQSRIFQQMTVPDILREVLAGLDFTFQIQGTMKPRDYCVQYRESDFAFVSRLMEEEGIFYFFRHTADGHQMILANAPQSHPDVPGPVEAIYESVHGGSRAEDRILAWRKTQEIRAGRYTLRDYCFEMPDKSLEARRPITDQVQVGSVAHRLTIGQGETEIYDYPGRYAQRFDGVAPGGGDQSGQLSEIFDDGLRTVGIRMQQESTPALIVDGEGGCRQFASGHKFNLERHFNGDGPYILTAVEHEASMEGAYTSDRQVPLDYRNTFRCIPASVTFRPSQSTPRPRVEGPQTAVVVGPPGDDQIFCDQYGRVKVQFPWDRQGQSNADSSCWIRVAQPWAGGGFGAIAIPRIGHEVLVDFEHGDPDTPIVVGCVYNAHNMPPFPLPQNKTQSGFKTMTNSGSATSNRNFHGLGFEDYEGQEHVQLHSEKHMTHSCEQKMFTNAGVSHHVNIGQASTRQVGGLPLIDHTLTVGGGGHGGGGPGPGPVVGGGGSGGGRGGRGRREVDSGWGGGVDTNPYYSAGPYYWNPNVMGSWANDLDLVIGWRQCNTLGLYSTTTVGQYIGTAINPLAAVELLGSVIPIVGVGAWFGELLQTNESFAHALATNAVAAVNIGSSTTLQYGATIEAKHGFSFQYNTDDKVTAALTRLVALTYTTNAILDMFYPALFPDSKDGKIAGTVVGIALTELLLGLWASLERKYAGYKVTEALEETVTVKRWNLTGALELEEVEVQETQTIWSAQFAKWLLEEGDGGAGGPGDPPGGQLVMSDNVYQINAPMISLLSSPSDTSTTPSAIDLQALGTLEEPGVVSIFGSGGISLSGGAQAGIGLTTVEETIGQVVVDCGAEGTMTLQSGITKEPNHITMNPEGITISSLEQVAVQCDENSITMTPEGITLLATESSIAMTPEGITLSCGPCSIEITPEGITINGLTLTVSGDAEVAISGPMITIGP